MATARSISNDIGVALSGNGSQILFTTKLHQAPKTLDVPLGFDVGLPGLGLNVDGNVQAKLGFDFKLSFGLNKTDGFFLSPIRAMRRIIRFLN